MAEQTGPPGGGQDSLSVFAAGQSGRQDRSEAAAIPKEKVKQEQHELTCNFAAAASWLLVTPAQHCHLGQVTRGWSGQGPGGWEGLRLNLTSSRVTATAHGRTRGAQPCTAHEAGGGCIPTMPWDRDAAYQEGRWAGPEGQGSCEACPPAVGGVGVGCRTLSHSPTGGVCPVCTCVYDTASPEAEPGRGQQQEREAGTCWPESAQASSGPPPQAPTAVSPLPVLSFPKPKTSVHFVGGHRWPFHVFKIRRAFTPGKAASGLPGG